MNIRVKALFIIGIVAGLSSCKKNNDAPTSQATTSLNFINASTNTINFFLNGTRITSTSSASSYSPGGTLGYLPVVSGTQNYQVKIAGPNTPNPLFSLTQTFDAGKSYSVYVSGQTAESLFFTNDVFVRPGADSVKLRFVNALPDAGTMAVTFKTVDKLDTKTTKGVVIGTGKFDNVPYKTTTDFIKTKSGVFIFSIYPVSSPANILPDTLTLGSGKIYTIYSYKSPSGTVGTQGFSAGLVVNQ